LSSTISRLKKKATKVPKERKTKILNKPDKLKERVAKINRLKAEI
jgi:hypothetical protein